MRLLGQTQATRATLRQKRVHRFRASFGRRQRNYAAGRDPSSFRQTSGPGDEDSPRPRDRSKKVNQNAYRSPNTTSQGRKWDGRGADGAQREETGGQTEVTRTSVVFSSTAAVQTELTLFAKNTRRHARSVFLRVVSVIGETELFNRENSFAELFRTPSFESATTRRGHERYRLTRRIQRTTCVKRLTNEFSDNIRLRSPYVYVLTIFF